MYKSLLSVGVINLVSYVIAIIVGGLFFAFDRFTKYLVVKNMPLGTGKDFIKGFIGFWHTSNEGGAWGFLEGYTWVLLSVTIIVMLICVALLLKYGLKDKLMFWAITLVLSGGLGNMYDRIFNDGKVVDFLRFEFIEFPVFNIADCAIVIGAGLMILYFVLDIIKDRQKAKLQ